jgi:hypothetical protein
MKLNSSQIEQLYSFTKAHYVDYYDLQTELVDHLANDIETQWELNPSIDFETSLNNAFKKFGVFGFEDVVLEKTKSLHKKYNKWVWQNLISFFKFPVIIGTFISMFLVFKLLVLGIENETYTNIVKGIIIISTVISLGYYFVKYYFYNKKKSLWLMENLVWKNGVSYTMSIVTNPIIIITGWILPTNNIYLILLLSFFIIISLLVNYIVMIKIPNNAKKYLLETYPYFLV